jgi:hypothetical protein
MTKHELGTGALNWSRDERIGNRYGFVAFFETDSRDQRIAPWTLDTALLRQLAGTRGRLVATIVTARDSTHIGDIALGVFPRRQLEGTRLVLGEGILRMGSAQGEGSLRFGVEPEDGAYPWMNVRALYDAHESVVRVTFEVAG